MSPFVLSDADLATTTELAAKRRERTTVAAAMAELFGDSFARALHRETAYAVPLVERTTCPIHLDWVTGCTELHINYPAAA
ncbi:hypothetical protein ACFVAF_25410 [Streptomyces sp. NPDC057596]|uniref:hypothetical protein n=1 Tax=Streptomyces sp. NPDC057596 TaxID=3346178 RepID=UPI0036B6EEE6